MQAINPSDHQQIEQMNMLATHASSVNVAERTLAEQQIKTFQNCVDQQTGFVVLLLHVAASGASGASFCSIVLKNTVKQSWDSQNAEHSIQEVDKATIRELIIGIMLQAPPTIQRNLAETIALIAKVDFPGAWPNPLETIIQALESNPPLSLRCAALSTAHSILVKYRESAGMTETYVAILRNVYATFSLPLINSMAMLLSLIESGSAAEASMACKGFTAAVECILDISVLDMTEEMLAHKGALRDFFLRCLLSNNPALAGASSSSSVLIELKSVVTSCVNHFLNTFDEDFEKEAPEFLKTVWDMLASPQSATPGMDDLVIQALELLSSACEGTSRKAFDNVDLLSDLLQHVIIPNLTLSAEDVEMYEAEPDAYIQRDIEGSDLHTRRRAAGDLVRSLMKSVPDKSRPLLLDVTNHLLSAPMEDWKSKDAGIYLASSLALEGQHLDAHRGVTKQQLSSTIPFLDFLKVFILPELASDISQARPAIIKADCMRVVTTFRNHIPPALFPSLLEMLPRWLSTQDWVLMSYAAHMCERLMLVQQDRQNIVTEAVLEPIAPTFFHSLCSALRASEQPNAYIAQCLMRACQRVPRAAHPHVRDLVETINVVVQRTCRNPSNPVFNHCIFEVLSRCINLQASHGPMFERILWNTLIYILTHDVVEYVPYVLQIMAQLLRTHTAHVDEPPAEYKDLLEPLMQPAIFEQRGNIPAVICLLTAFIECYPVFINRMGYIRKLLDIFYFLVQLRNYDHEGFNILTSLLLAYPPDLMNPYFTNIILILMERLKKTRTPKYVRILIIFLSMAVCLRSPEDLMTHMEGVQSGLFLMFLNGVWLPNVQKITGTLERKVCIVALTRLLCESSTLQQTPEMWAKGVHSCLRMIHDSVEEDDHVSFLPKGATVGDPLHKQEEGFTNVFCSLEGAIRKPVDVCHSVLNPNAYFKDQLKHFLNGPGAALVSTLQHYLPPECVMLIQ